MVCVYLILIVIGILGLTYIESEPLLLL